MKKCRFCDMAVEDTASVCPHCCGNEFVALCASCGSPMNGGTCTKCAAFAASRAQANERAQAQALKQAAAQKANSGLIWKSILTFFFPFIGGYFLVGPDVATGRKAYALIWCVAYFVIGASQSDIFTEEPAVALITCLIFLGPVIYWLFGLVRK